VTAVTVWALFVPGLITLHFKMKRKYSGKTRTAKRRKIASTKKTVQALVRRALGKMVETKKYARARENRQLYHNSVNNFFNLVTTVQGTGQHNRIGDKINAKGLKIKLWLSNKSDRPNVLYRIMVISGDLPNTTDITDLFETPDEGTNGNKMTLPVNTEKYRVVYQKNVKLTQLMTYSAGSTGPVVGKEQSKMFSIWLPMRNRSIKYVQQNGTLPTELKNRLGLVIIPYDAYGTLTTDNIASYDFHSTLYYKDA